MPKISSNSISVYNKDIKKRFEVTVMYNQKYLFYAAIPVEFKDIINHLSETERIDFNIVIDYKSKYERSANSPYEAYVKADSEAQCLDRIKKVLEELIIISITKRDVIILFYNPKDVVNYNEHKMNNEHPMIGLQLGLTYAVETSVGEQKVYSVYEEYKTASYSTKERRQLNLYNKASTIIPDTPENRLKLEQLYEALRILNIKLSEFTSSSDKLLEFISGNVKLLT